ncbi:hypothetical protein [Paenibacillus sp. YYML68]|uniref:hypothetical protein n=1 Tax=Paenibacillus sp. YYML68 TaxID=2909250 RepID=UPI0024907148|nr:hypothetical protein [Paenibacillus sp. YYML68]
MSKHLQAYFHTENEAEDVRILLQTYAVEQIEVGQLQSTSGDDANFMPYSPSLGSANVAVGVPALGAGNNTNGAPGFMPVFFNLDDEVGEDGGGFRGFSYVLSALVEDRDFEKVVDVVHSNGGRVLKLEE